MTKVERLIRKISIRRIYVPTNFKWVTYKKSYYNYLEQYDYRTFPVGFIGIRLRSWSRFYWHDQDTQSNTRRHTVTSVGSMGIPVFQSEMSSIFSVRLVKLIKHFQLTITPFPRRGNQIRCTSTYLYFEPTPYLIPVHTLTPTFSSVILTLYRARVI